MNEFIDYLRQRQLSHSTIKTCQRSMAIYLKWATKERLALEQITYQDLLSFMKYCTRTGKAQKTIQHYLNTIRHYYDHLVQEQRVEINPVIGIEVKGVKRKALYHILEPHELHALYHQYPNETYRDKRNKVMLGLLVYQGIRTEELARMTTVAIQLREGKIDVLGSRKNNSRLMQLESHQVMDVYDYMLQVRPEILQMKPKRTTQIKVDTDRAFIAEGGNCYRVSNLITQIMRKVRQINPSVQNARQIRVSVITKWVKMYNLRKAQYLAGHRYISTTESYLQNDIEGLQEELNQYHPLN